MERDMFQIDITPEVFDAIEGCHTFSRSYNKRKEAELIRFKKEAHSKSRMRLAGICTAAAALVFAVPIGVNAATDGELFRRLWGTSGKPKVESHEYTWNDEKGEHTVVLPEQEYEDMAPEKAESLIGENLSTEPISAVMGGDTTIEILSAVRDDRCAVVEYTLSKEGGVDCLVYSQINNELKGAVISEDIPFSYRFAEGGGKIFVDLEKSTADKLYCYDYITLHDGFRQNGETVADRIASNSSADKPDKLTLVIDEYIGNRSEFFNKDIAYEDLLKNSRSIDIPLKEKAGSVFFTDSKNTGAIVSPISMDFDSILACEEALEMKDLSDFYESDPDEFLRYLNGDTMVYTWLVKISYKDGSEYIVRDNTSPSKSHIAEPEKNNTQYICNNTMIFNRLVDVDNIESITINDHVLTRKE